MIPRIYQRIVSRFRDVYGPKSEVKLFFAPGRITVMGQHTDYNGGSMLDCAVERGTYIVARKRNDNKVYLYAHSLKAKKSMLIEKDMSCASGEEVWVKCIRGALAVLVEEKYSISGMDIYLYGDLPYNTSLASSSSLTACFVMAAMSTSGIDIEDKINLANISYKAEMKFNSHKISLHTFIAIFTSKQSHLTLYNTKTEELSHIPFVFDEYSLVVINSNKKRTVADSEYNSRKRECANALKKIKEEKASVECICDMTSKGKDAKIIETVLNPKEKE